MCIRDSYWNDFFFLRIHCLLFRPEVEIHQIIIHLPGPVSYTHLDVYKRQTVYRIQTAGAGKKGPPLLFHRGITDRPGAFSYCLLQKFLILGHYQDVYKRQAFLHFQTTKFPPEATCFHLASIILFPPPSHNAPHKNNAQGAFQSLSVSISPIPL